jgi:glycosyltransferase involved in cell wall biosynthesis
LPTPRITVGVPVYKGSDRIGKALDCLQSQTYGNFEAIISVDGNDEETAAACRPYLADRRFRMVVQPERLDWVGNFNWLLRQDLRELYCYRQHDDTTSPDFFELLLKTADAEPRASAIYCDCRHEPVGGRASIETFPSIEGHPWERLLFFFETYSNIPLRGLLRSAGIREAGLVRTDEFRAPHQAYSWLAKLLRLGPFQRVPGAFYYKADLPQNYSNEFMRASAERRRAAWPTIFTGFLEAAMPLCHTPRQRLFLQRALLYRTVTSPRFFPQTEMIDSEALVAECMARLKQEGNAHLLNDTELPVVVKRLPPLSLLRDPPAWERAQYRLRERNTLAALIHSRSRWKRTIYRARYLWAMVARRLSSLLRKST